MMVKLKTPATAANIGPGFDSLGLALELYNYLEITTQSTGLTIEVTGEGQELARNEQNLVYQAATKVFTQANNTPSGIYIKQHNNIPLTKGLGSSAAAIISGLVGANKLIGSPFSQPELLNMAYEMEGHPDNITPALLGGVVAACFAENEVKHIVTKPLLDLDIVVVTPDFQLETTKARQALPKSVNLSDAVFNIGRASILISAFITGQYEHLAWGTEDKLHQDYRAKLIPGFYDVIQTIKESGGLAGFLSGAGPTILAFTQNNPQLIGQNMSNAFKQHGIDSTIIYTKISKTGTQEIN